MALKSVMSVISGYDIFISYRRKENVMKYALSLAEELEKRGLNCFIDEKKLARGESIPTSIRRGIRKSKMFVLLATGDLTGSKWIPVELAEADKHKRKIVPVNFSGELDKLSLSVKPWEALKDRSRIEEGIAALDTGKPSSHVAAEIDLAYNFTRQRTIATRNLFIAGLIFLGVSIIAALSAVEAWNIRVSAEEETRFLNIKSDEARAEADNAQEQKRSAQQARDKARSEKEQAEKEKKTAIDEKNTALGAATDARKQQQEAESKAAIAEARRRDADKEAKRQEAIATAHQLANRASLTLKQESHLLPRSILYAVESMKRFEELGMRSLDADLAVREGLTMLPPLERTIDLTRGGIERFALTHDGKYLAVASDDTARLWEMTSNRTFILPLGQGKRGGISELTFSENGKYLVTVYSDSDDGKSITEVWDTATGVRVALNDKYSGYIDVITFSPDGAYIAASLGKTVLVSDTVTGDAIAPALVCDGKVLALAFSPEGEHRYLATGSADYFARVWDLRNPDRPIALIKHSNSTVNNVTFNKDGKYLATASYTSGKSNAVVQVWDWKVNSEGPIIPPLRHNNGIEEIIFSPNNKQLATSCDDRSVRIWDLGNGDEVQRLKHNNFIEAMAFSPSGEYLATGTGDNTSRVWSVSSGQEILRMYHEGAIGAIRVVAFSPDSQHLITVSTDDTARIWGITPGQPVVHSQHIGDVQSITFSPDGQYFVTAEAVDSIAGIFGAYVGRNYAHIWELKSGREVSTVITHEAGVKAVAFDPSGKYLVTASADGAVCIWDKWNLGPHPHEVTCINGRRAVNAIAISYDGQYLAIASDDTFAVVWKDWYTTHPQPVATIKHPDKVKSVAFSQKENLLATGCSDGFARIWKWQDNSREPLASLKHGPIVASISFSPDGRYVATAGFKETADVWEWMVNVDKPLVSLQHETSVWSVAFDMTGKYLATSSSDYTTRIWEEWNKPQPVEVSRIAQETVATSIAFSWDSKYLGTASDKANGTAQVWLWQPNDLINESCLRLKRNLTLKEWNAYLAKEPYRKTCQNITFP